MEYEILIIGAGAAGLMAGATLAEAGFSCCIIEASATAGGRMRTLEIAGFDTPVETGAEFIHGDLPLTKSLLDRAGIRYVPVEGDMISVRNGEWKRGTAHDRHWPAFLRELRKLQEDCSLQEVLDRHFTGAAYQGLRQAVTSFAQGFDLADLSRASAAAAEREWGESGENQYRVEGGYQRLVDHLVQRCRAAGASFGFDFPVTVVEATGNGLTVTNSRGEWLSGKRVLITASVGMLQGGQIEFRPAPDKRYTAAFTGMGFGEVIKFLFQFSNRFWEAYAKDPGFLLSDESIPTWWTNYPLSPNLLTGWLGGPPAAALSAASDDERSALALSSLARIFTKPEAWLKANLTASHISCWQQHPYAKGGYSYPTVTTAASRKTLSHPLHGLIYFSGEAMHNGLSQGTVEAALQNGLDTAKAIMGSLPNAQAAQPAAV